MGALANIAPAPGVVPIAGPSGKLDPSWVPEATSGTSGTVSTGTQTFTGDKTFDGDLAINGAVLQTHSSSLATGENANVTLATNTAGLNNNESASGHVSQYIINPGSSSGAPCYYTGFGVSVDTVSAANNRLSGATQYGSKSIINYANAATSGTSVDYLIGCEVEFIITMGQTSGSTTINNVVGFQCSPGPVSTAAGGTTFITTYKGLEILPVAIAGAGTTTITNHWNLYSADTAGGSYFGSPVFIVGAHTPVVGGLAHQGAGGVRTRRASTQDAVALLGRAGGTSSRANTITTAALGGDRTTTLPDANLTFVTGGSLHLGGTAVLVAGTVTVANSAITANTRIFLTSQVDGGTVGFLRVSARVVSASFTITSSSVLDTSTVAWFYTEP